MEAIIGVHVRPPPSQRDFGCRKCPPYSARTVQLPPHVPRTAPRSPLPGHPRRRRAAAQIIILWICERNSTKIGVHLWATSIVPVRM